MKSKGLVGHSRKDLFCENNKASEKSEKGEPIGKNWGTSLFLSINRWRIWWRIYGARFPVSIKENARKKEKPQIGRGITVCGCGICHQPDIVCIKKRRTRYQKITGA